MAIGWNTLPIKSAQKSASMTKYRSIFLIIGLGQESRMFFQCKLVKILNQNKLNRNIQKNAHTYAMVAMELEAMFLFTIKMAHIH